MPDAPNPFEAAMQQARSTAEEFSRRLTDMKLPMLPNADALVAAHQRNMEAFTAANRVALEGAQTVAKRQMEIVQQTIAELTEAMRALAEGGSPTEKAARHAEQLKRAYERAVANTTELSELIQRANGEAIELLNRRVAEAMDEMKALMEKAGKA